MSGRRDAFDRFVGTGRSAAVLLCGLQLAIAFMMLAPPDHVIPRSARAQALVMCGVLAIAAGVVMARWSRARGYSAWWGLLAALNLAGVVVIAALPRRRRQAGFDVLPAEPDDTGTSR